MQFSLRAAIVIAVFCAASLAGSGTPGFAIELDRTLVITAPASTDSPGISNVLAPASVPSAPIVPTATPPSDPVIADDPQNIDRGLPVERRSYATLAAAVAAQEPPMTVDSDLACLAGTIFFESKGESLQGQLAVANVVINRTKSGRFPRSICSVVKQPGQFSFVRGGRMPSIGNGNAQYRTALAVAQVAMAERWESPVANALFFHARHVSPGWRLTRVAAIGGHVFYR
ncbi:cell wall hydrolase [Sphingomonas sp. 28-62-11]|uniref:cell wall hydrolase n=1 Tax=Sphingomonas sp. 28-62-11 TaxID=1970432 RepID=UPI000BC8B6D4|nr:MAG: hypothetical protein B7Y49_09215 [Sphingomonas sp. 28-62-11]